MIARYVRWRREFSPSYRATLRFAGIWLTFLELVCNVVMLRSGLSYGGEGGRHGPKGLIMPFPGEQALTPTSLAAHCGTPKIETRKSKLENIFMSYMGGTVSQCGCWIFDFSLDAAGRGRILSFRFSAALRRVERREVSKQGGLRRNLLKNEVRSHQVVENKESRFGTNPRTNPK